MTDRFCQKCEPDSPWANASEILKTDHAVDDRFDAHCLHRTYKIFLVLPTANN